MTPPFTIAPGNPTSDTRFPVYFQSDYSSLHDYENLTMVESDDYFLLLDQNNKQAKSFPKSPFGSIIKKGNSSDNLEDFVNRLSTELQTKGIEELTLVHPPEFYSRFVNAKDLIDLGCTVKWIDQCQYLELDNPIELHPMQIRKLKALRKNESIYVRQTEDFSRIHDFLSACRQEQGLQINIDHDRLLLMANKLPNTLTAWEVMNENETISAVIMTRVDEFIWYYYLPGTIARYRSLSPMVLLVDEITKKAIQNGFKFLDLGVSSIQGEKQEGLFKFKERMGARSVEKFTLGLTL